MKKISEILLITIYLSFLSILLFTQTDSLSLNETDEEFNLFLFTLLLIGISGIIGAAIIGGIGAALVLFFLFALIGMGAISTSIAVGSYKKILLCRF